MVKNLWYAKLLTGRVQRAAAQFIIFCNIWHSAILIADGLVLEELQYVWKCKSLWLIRPSLSSEHVSFLYLVETTLVETTYNTDAPTNK